MTIIALRLVPGALFLLYLLIAAVHLARRPRPTLLAILFALGHVPALLYFYTHAMDPYLFYVHRYVRVLGDPLLLLGVVLYFAALLEQRKPAGFPTGGPYRLMRHPVYAAWFLVGTGLALVSANRVVAPAFLVPLTLLYLVRARAEERSLLDRHGDAWRDYADRTGRLFPRPLKRLLARRSVQAAILLPAALVLAACVTLAVDGLRDELGKADVAVVLGNKVFPNGKPGTFLRSRLDATVRLYREGWFPEILVSGGTGREGHDEARVMRQYLIEHGVPADRIHTDSFGVNTRATARNAAAFMRDRHMKTAMVISQYYHVPRARMALRRAGVPTVYAAHARRFFTRHDIYAIPRELLALLYYRLSS